MKEYSHDPCPWRVVDDCGGAFTTVSISEAVFQGIKGFRNAPSGIGRRFISSIATIKAHAPITAGNCAILVGMFSTIDCTLVHIRKKEDPWNSIFSGAASCGILAARNGLSAIAGSAITGGVFLALVNGICYLSTRFSVKQFKPLLPLTEDPSQLESPQTEFSQSTSQ